MSVPREWFRSWFGTAYLALYPHRDEAEAAAGVDLFLERAGVEPGQRVLDLACGAGRHLVRLRERGRPAIGLDLSAILLHEARRRPHLARALVRGDMRHLPFADGAFAGLVNFFTSFGYFPSTEEDGLVVSEMRRVLEPGAPFLIDYLNASRVLERLEPETVSETEGRTVRQTRWVEGEHIVKRIEIQEGEAADVYYERVRLYEPGELEAMLSSHGLTTDDRFGSYEGSPFAPDSPRLLLIGHAA